ncbi:hypothetical protein ACFQZO_28975 [Bradyrhizobium sp. GCM10027634]|uniref:hypothetical protein n=1 Tax=unclassified Bradyrhizobium TaxID=2631580 RepID=UPI00188C5B63|nr:MULTISPECIES: hypothetical protein [unclassified Bradyrhizobium]MDN5004892.1 hypothetical protein [Bradyrhizobium sp. WYCCWR 12677]QOZ45184.1 hypothetical protein XH89_18155 [Bradyrhizobium sp. CCBAU 53340]
MGLPSQANEGSGAVKKWGFVAMHAALAAAFMFLLQRFVMNAPQETSLLWALTFAVCAAGLAYKQSNR